MSDFPDVLPTFPPPPSPEMLRTWFKTALDSLGGPSILAQQMHKLGDKRAFESSLRGVQRMASGETRVSGEMVVIAELLMRARRRAECEAAKLKWEEIQQRCVSTKTRDFTITLSPQTRGRWHVNLMHKDGYSPPWPSWQSTLEDAKITAMLSLEDALDDLRTTEINRDVSNIVTDANQ